MSTTITLVLLMGSIATTFAALALGPAIVHPNEPGKCYVSTEEKYYSPGESWNLEDCAQATCFMSNYTGTPELMVSYASCGIAHAEPPCYIKEDTSLQYPACCPQPICPEDSEKTGTPSSTEETEEAGSLEQHNIDYNDEENEIEGSNNHFSDFPFYSLLQFNNKKNGNSKDNVEINYYNDMKPESKKYNQESSVSSSSNWKKTEVDPMDSYILPHLFPQSSDYADDDYYNLKSRKFSPKFHYSEPSLSSMFSDSDSSYSWW